MERTAAGRVLRLGLVLILLWPSATARAEGCQASRRSAGPWEEVVIDGAGRLVAAFGHDEAREPILIAISSTPGAGRMDTALTYVRSAETLRVERVSDVASGIRTLYQTGAGWLEISYAADADFARTFVTARESGGRSAVITVVPSTGEIAGDIEGYRRVVRQPKDLARILDRYAGDTAGLEATALALQDPVMWRVPDGECLDKCADRCPQQCRWECLIAPWACPACLAACAAGCAIGCGS